ncbi:unnamed protein product [Prunus armeniaca]
MIVATDYFTKWIEVEALFSIKEADVVRFIWRNIICRFGCPQSLATDNNSQSIGRQITTNQSPISSVLRETQPVRSVLRETQGRQDRHAVAHKQHPKGDAGRRPKRPLGDAARKKSPKGDAGGGRIDTQLPISSVLRETQGDDQAILRDVQHTPGAS